MDEVTNMIKKLLEMEVEHLNRGLITKEFAKNAIVAFIQSLMLPGENEAEKKCNQLITYLSQWAGIYIENVNIKKGD